MNTNPTILFQGDSITDSSRGFANPSDLGNGYAMMTALQLRSNFPKIQFSFINRGVSGDTIINLKNRWERDCIALEPDLVSILIGINDTWQQYNHIRPYTAKQFESDYRYILDLTLKKTKASIILLEPFLLHFPPDIIDCRKYLNPRIQICFKLAQEYKLPLVRLDSAFQKHSQTNPPQHWAGDGVHPTPEGHAVIADEWVKAFARLKIAGSIDD